LVVRATPFVGYLSSILFALTACGPSTIRVVGVVQQSSEMRPLPAVPLDGYQQLRLFVRAAPRQSTHQYGALDCGFARLEGTSEEDDRNNAACVPVETLNLAVGIVRQRLRSYGIHVVRDASEAHDFAVEVGVTGEAPRKPDRTLAKAFAKVTMKRAETPATSTLVGSIDWSAAAPALDSAAKICGLRSADEPSGLSASSTEPMAPGFDLLALTCNAVDNLLRCYDLARFFQDARSRFPKASNAQQPPAL
jgi:hypothetical protein